LTGHQPGGVDLADMADNGLPCYSDSVFQTPDVRILQGTAPFLIVAKKHVKVLEKIDSWLKMLDGFFKPCPFW
jgi:hypothetical protein